ncbi:hypothetical protein GX586_16085 [bacterium]|nr:hypothetical protein [bacterium]
MNRRALCLCAIFAVCAPCARAAVIAADTITYAWDMMFTVTSIPRGTGSAVWRSPEPIALGGAAYVFTSRVQAVAHLLPPFFGTYVIGDVYQVTNVGPLGTLPFYLLNETLRQTSVQTIFTITFTGVASSHIEVYIDTDAFFYSKTLDFVVTNVTLGGYVSVYVDTTGLLTNGAGIRLSVIPEPCAALPSAATCAGFIACRRRRSR